MCLFVFAVFLVLMGCALPVEARKSGPAGVDSLLAAALDRALSHKERVKIIKKVMGYNRSG